MAAWQRGALLMSYMGHSSWHQWPSNRFLTSRRARSAERSRWPVVLSMTCFTGFFHHPEYGTLDESLLRVTRAAVRWPRGPRADWV